MTEFGRQTPFWHGSGSFEDPGSGSLFFSANDREWIAAKWALIRDANQRADKAVNKWRKVSDEVNDYMDRAGITDPLQRTKVKGENLELKDLLGTGQWYREEARGHIADVNLFLRLKEHRLL